LNARKVTSNIKPIAQAGLIAKGVIYALLGSLALMAAFNINGQNVNKTDESGVFGFILKQTGGMIILGIIVLGLCCYCIWRGIQAFADTEKKGNTGKGLIVRGRYLFSGLAYALLAIYGIEKLASPLASGW
jgi:hypothetical protein